MHTIQSRAPRTNVLFVASPPSHRHKDTSVFLHPEPSRHSICPGCSLLENSVLQNQAEMSPPWPSRLLAGPFPRLLEFLVPQCVAVPRAVREGCRREQTGLLEGGQAGAGSRLLGARGPAHRRCSLRVCFIYEQSRRRPLSMTKGRCLGQKGFTPSPWWGPRYKPPCTRVRTCEPAAF